MNGGSSGTWRKTSARLPNFGCAGLKLPAYSVSALRFRRSASPATHVPSIVASAGWRRYATYEATVVSTPQIANAENCGAPGVDERRKLRHVAEDERAVAELRMRGIEVAGVQRERAALQKIGIAGDPCPLDR